MLNLRQRTNKGINDKLKKSLPDGLENEGTEREAIKP